MEIVRNGESQGLSKLTNQGNETYTLSTELFKGSDYQFFFWADPGSAYFSFTNDDANMNLSATDMSNITMHSPAVAYWGYKSITPTDDTPAVTIELTHAVAKVSFVTSTALQLAGSEAGNTLTMTIPNTYSGLNVKALADNNGVIEVGAQSDLTCSAVLTSALEANTTIFSTYAIVPQSNSVQEVTLQYGYAPTVTVSNVPISINTHTKLLGDISNQATVSVTASISPSWENEGGTLGEEEDDDEPFEWVDLGTSVLWGNKNLGASSSSDSGGFYQWGALEPVNLGSFPSSYDIDYTCDSQNILNSTFDAATYNNQGRIPTKQDFLELINLYSNSSVLNFVPVTINGISGIQVDNALTTGSIFFPNIGYYNNQGSFVEGMYYWTSTLNTNSSYKASSIAEVINISNFSFVRVNVAYALPIRPVKDKD